MKRKFTVLFVLFAGIICQSKINAQVSFAELENNKIMYPAPTAAGLGKYGEYPVSLYNGLVNIGQDIVTVKSGRLALNVSLSYHASGNRPSDIPGWVGLGFSLNAGGVITRVIKDLPDDLSGGFYADNTSVQYWWNNYPNSEFIERYYSGTIDPRSDVYQFNFCGKAGEFVFDWDRHIHFKEQVPFKVQELYGSGGFSGFKVTTDDGTIYTFDQAEHSQLTALSVNPTASSWYLTRIENLNGDNIVLKYTAPMNKFRYKQYSTRKEVTGTGSGILLVTGPTVNVNTSKDEVIYLDEIDFDNGKLTFGKSTRTDPYFIPDGISSSTVEEQKLDLISLEDNSNNLIKQWKFEYFENSTERLKLKTLTAQGSDQTDVQKYSFSYNITKLPLPLPGPNPSNPYLSNDVDFWGYYNAAGNGDNRIPLMYVSEFNQYVGSANRSINPTFAGAEMLTKITYPTGGYASFEYEPNDYSAQGDSYAAAQNPMTFQEDLTESYTFRYDRDDGGFDTDPATLTFTLTEPTHVYIRYSCGADGPLHSWANPGTNYENDYQMAAGTYTLEGLLNTDELTSPNSADITRAQAFVTVYKKGPVMPLIARVGPGMRIKSIATNDGMTTTTRSFEYKLTNSTQSSGFLSVFPAFYALLQSFAGNMQGLYLASEPINDISEGSPVGYSRVVERFQDNSTIVHYYDTYGDHPDEKMSFTNGYSDSRLAHMSSEDFQRGQETGTEYYNASGVIQKVISNSYDVLPESITDVQAIELKPTVGIQEYLSGPVNNINATLSSLYYVHSCFPYNSTRFETTYDKDGLNPMTTYVSTYFDNVKHLQPTRIATPGSDGSLLTTVTSFADDFAPGTPFIDYMQANHLTSFPIEQVTYKQKGGVNNIIGGNIITYKAGGAGLPDQLLRLETAGPISQTSFKFSDRSMGVLPPSSQASAYGPDTHFKPLMSYGAYDAKGKLLQQNKVNDQQHAYIWDYNGTYPVAEATNASQTDIAYTSFEADGSGNWTLGSTNRNPSGITGHSSYILNSDISKSGLSSSGSYFVTYWTQNNNSFSIDGTVSGYPKKGKSINNWTLYVHKITGKTSIAIVGGGNIDELRLYPADGQMTTSTFDPLIGITSSCDAGSRITYYEYDNFQRLRRVRDQDYNILKSYDYKYQDNATCGNNCYVLTMRNANFSNTIGYPVGVFNINGTLIGNASTAAEFVTLWNSDALDIQRGTLSTGSDPLHFNLTLNSGQTVLNAVTGRRYYQYDFSGNSISVSSDAGAYVDYGDGAKGNPGGGSHTYADMTTKTITIYHNEEASGNPALGINSQLRNFRGNIQQNITRLIFTATDPSVFTTDGITNWGNINSLQSFAIGNSSTNVNLAQDCLKNNKDLQTIATHGSSYDYYSWGCADPNFKIGVLKSDWNTYFSKLSLLSLNDHHWNREDLSGLLYLKYFSLVADNQQHNGNPVSNPIIPIPTSVIDNVINQIAAGAGKYIHNGIIYILSGGSSRSSVSDSALAKLKSMGWAITLDNQSL